MYVPINQSQIRGREGKAHGRYVWGNRKAAKTIEKINNSAVALLPI